LNSAANVDSGLERLNRWCVNDALPYWASTGFDESHGHFVEGLALDGTPESSGGLRTRSAARLIYVFAQSASLGVAPTDGLAKAEVAFDSLHRCAWQAGEKPGYARAFNRFGGHVTDPSRDLYDHACVLLALAWLLKATDKDLYRVRITEVLHAIDVTLAAPHGGWAEDSENAMPRRQNPHMHFFEACLALVEVTGDPAHIARATKLFNLFESRFYDKRIEVLREYFGPAWEVDVAFGSGRLDPGHMAEWVWLLRRYASFGSTDVGLFCARLLLAAETLGADPKSCFLLDEVSEQGTVLKGSRRLWPQAELIKAHLVQHKATGNAVHIGQANRIASELFKTYLAQAPKAGTWRDCFDLEGHSIGATIPSSSLYHLWTAVAEVLA
jgi:mannose/cellobiose epimerase-like protein (N-acyl-D-glucosamine 2-epimerase family)